MAPDWFYLQIPRVSEINICKEHREEIFNDGTECTRWRIARHRYWGFK